MVYKRFIQLCLQPVLLLEGREKDCYSYAETVCPRCNYRGKQCSAVQCSAVLATRDQTKAQAKGKKFKIWFSPKFLGLIKLVTHADLRQIVDSID